MDEGVVSPVELEEFIHLKMIDGMAMKPARCGGLWSNAKQIELCLQHKLQWLGSGLTDPDISLAAALGLYGAYGLRRPRRAQWPAVPDRQRPGDSPENRRRPRPCSDRPGLGIEVDEDKVVDLMKRSGGDKLIRR